MPTYKDIEALVPSELLDFGRVVSAIHVRGERTALEALGPSEDNGIDPGYLIESIQHLTAVSLIV